MTDKLLLYFAICWNFSPTICVRASETEACISNPCLNNGICSNSPTGFICTCINGYLGLRCERKSDECSTDVGIDCIHGQCRLMSDGRPTCHCLQGYGGPYCSKDFNSCHFIPCLNNGTCINETDGYRCSCPLGFKGSHCQIEVKELNNFLNLCESGHSMLRGGKCWDGRNTTVSVGWGYGDNLCNSVQTCFNMGNISGIHYIDVQLKPIQMEPQQSLVFLTEDDASLYNFKFIPNILPVETESARAFLDCNKNNSIQLTHVDRIGKLLVNATLLSLGLHYFIADLNAIHRCEFGLRLNVSIKDRDCSDPLSVSGFCNGRGLCYTDYTMSRYQCKCHESMIGKYCERENPCSKKPCKYGGKCLISRGDIDGFEEFVCKCPTGRTGVDCSELLDKCNSRPCFHGAKCQMVGDKFQCNCAHGFTGNLCEINIDECQSNPCKNGGKCIDGSHSFNCICKPGFKGTLCEVNLDDCHSNPCRNGTCIDEINSFKCHCAAGYSGELCEVSLDECSSSPCVNGRCVDLVNGYRCSCGIGFTGHLCEFKVDLCKNSLHCITANSKKCIDHGTNVTCSCLAGYKGNNCGINIDDCYHNPCHNDGTCIDEVNGSSCKCRMGNYGRFCEGTAQSHTSVVSTNLNGMKTITSLPTTAVSFEVHLKFKSKACKGNQIQQGEESVNALLNAVVHLCNCSFQVSAVIPTTTQVYCQENGFGDLLFKVMTSQTVTLPTVLCPLKWAITRMPAENASQLVFTEIQSDTSVCSKGATRNSNDSKHRDTGIVIGLVVGLLILAAIAVATAIKLRNMRNERVSNVSEKRRVKAYINLTYEGPWVRGLEDEPVLQKMTSEEFFDVFDPIQENTKV